VTPAKRTRLFSRLQTEPVATSVKALVARMLALEPLPSALLVGDAAGIVALLARHRLLPLLRAACWAQKPCPRAENHRGGASTTKSASALLAQPA
jgi:hypothetical protein